MKEEERKREGVKFYFCLYLFKLLFEGKKPSFPGGDYEKKKEDGQNLE
jgi:hypothetical protein